MESKVYKQFLGYNQKLLRAIEKENPVLVLPDWEYLLDVTGLIFFSIWAFCLSIYFLLDPKYNVFYSWALFFSSLLCFLKGIKGLYSFEFKRPYLLLKKNGSFTIYTLEKKIGDFCQTRSTLINSKNIGVFLKLLIERFKIFKEGSKQDAPNLWFFLILISYPIFLVFELGAILACFILSRILLKLKREYIVLFCFVESKKQFLILSFLTEEEKRILFTYFK